MITANDLPAVAWRKSSRSANGSSQCVEAGPLLDTTGRVAVRHSRRPLAEVLVFAGPSWRSFVDDVRAGAFDLGD